jgi:hypothetical protein
MVLYLEGFVRRGRREAPSSATAKPSQCSWPHSEFQGGDIYCKLSLAVWSFNIYFNIWNLPTFNFYNIWSTCPLFLMPTLGGLGGRGSARSAVAKTAKPSKWPHSEFQGGDIYVELSLAVWSFTIYVIYVTYPKLIVYNIWWSCPYFVKPGARRYFFLPEKWYRAARSAVLEDGEAV